MNVKRQNEPESGPAPDGFDILLRVGAFAIVGYVALVLVSSAMIQADGIVRSTLAVFAAGLAANFFVARKFEHGRPSDVGFGWQPNSNRQLIGGLGVGAGAVIALVAAAVSLELAEYDPATAERSPLFLAILLLVHAVGEELLFRGYAFQYLIRNWSPPLTILLSGAFFGLAHLSNANVGPLGAANTALWGFLLGYAYTRARTLWLPIAIHFGWNLASVLFTSNLSGTTIKATAWSLRWSASDLWSGGAYGIEGGLLVTIVALPVFWFVRRVR